MRSSKKNPLVSILTISYNEKDRLMTLLKSFKKLNFKDYEIIICDNNSTDGTEEFIKKNYPKIKFIKSKKNIGSAVHNLAVPYCKGKYILYVGNDMELEKNCINELIKVMESDDKIALCAPKIMDYYDRKKIDDLGSWISRSFYAGKVKKVPDKIREVDSTGTGLIRKSVIKEVKYFIEPDYFMYGEDIELGLRIRLRGYKIINVPKAVIYHMGSQSIRIFGIPKITYYLERNMMTNFLKTLSIKNIFLLSPYVFGMRLITIIKDLITWKPKNAFARIKAIFWIIFHLGLIYKKRKETQKLRKVPDKYLLRLFTEKYIFKGN